MDKVTPLHGDVRVVAEWVKNVRHEVKGTKMKFASCGVADNVRTSTGMSRLDMSGVECLKRFWQEIASAYPLCGLANATLRHDISICRTET